MKGTGCSPDPAHPRSHKWSFVMTPESPGTRGISGIASRLHTYSPSVLSVELALDGARLRILQQLDAFLRNYVVLPFPSQSATHLPDVTSDGSSTVRRAIPSPPVISAQVSHYSNARRLYREPSPPPAPPSHIKRNSRCIEL